MWVGKKTQYGGDVVMFLPNKIIKYNKLNYPQKNVGLVETICTWFQNHVQGLLNSPWFYCTWFRRALQMVLRLCARPPKQPIVVGGPCIWFKNLVWVDVIIWFVKK